MLVFDSVLIVSVELPDDGFGENVTVDPAGAPVRLKFTAPLNPLVGVIVTV